MKELMFTALVFSPPVGSIWTDRDGQSWLIEQIGPGGVDEVNGEPWFEVWGSKLP